MLPEHHPKNTLRSECPSKESPTSPGQTRKPKKKHTVLKTMTALAVLAVSLAASRTWPLPGTQPDGDTSLLGTPVARASELNQLSDQNGQNLQPVAAQIIVQPVPAPGNLESHLSAFQMKELRSFLQTGNLQYFTGDVSASQKTALLAELEEVLPQMETAPVYSMYNPNTSEHLFTINEEERTKLSQIGWKDEGICFGSSKKEYGIPVYRLYLKKRGAHLYISSKAEADSLVKAGWVNEGAKFYATKLAGHPVIRLLNRNIPGGVHHFTSDPEEAAALVKAGWIEEGTAFKVLDPLSFESVSVNGQDGTAAYDSGGQALTGLIKLRTGAYYFDPDQNGLMVSGWLASPSGKNGELEERYFALDGKMARGEAELEDGWHFFDKTSGIHQKNQLIRHGSVKRTYYYDENGRKAIGRYLVDGRWMTFDPDSGALKEDLWLLLERCRALIEKNACPDEDYSLAIRIPETGEYVSWNNHSQQSASVMKLFVMAAVFDDYEAYCKQFGQSAIDSSLHAMITVSDNEAWSFLTSALAAGDFVRGVEALKAWNKEHGYTQTWMENRSYGNFTSVRDAGKILEDIYQGRLKYSDRMKELIKNQAIPGRLLAGIPDSVTTGNKGGWLDDTQNDSVMVWTDQGTYILTLMSTNLASTGNAMNIMRDVSAAVFSWMQENLATETVRKESAGTRPEENGLVEIETAQGAILIEPDEGTDKEEKASKEKASQEKEKPGKLIISRPEEEQTELVIDGLEKESLAD